MDRLALHRREYVLHWLADPERIRSDRTLLSALNMHRGIIAGGFVRDLCLHDHGLKAEFNDLDLWFPALNEWKHFQKYLFDCGCKTRNVCYEDYEEGMPGSFYIARFVAPRGLPIDVMCLNPQDERGYNTDIKESTCGLPVTAWDRYLENNFDYSVNLALIHPTHGLAISPSFADWLEMRERGEARLRVRSLQVLDNIAKDRRHRFESAFGNNAPLAYGFDTTCPWLCRGEEEVPF